MNYTEIASQLVVIIGILTVFVNIVTEVFKKVWVFKTAEAINRFVTTLSVILTVISFTAYWSIKDLEAKWYVFIAFVIIGFMVAYSAMFGFDKLLRYFKKEE